jgi:aminopeptidase N
VREPWLDEAFAELSTRLWLRETEGDDRTWSMTYLASEADPVRGAISARATDYEDNEDYIEDVYVGGSEILLDLRREVGPDVFDGLLRTWYRDTSGRIGTVDEFIGHARSSAGAEAARFLERWRD